MKNKNKQLCPNCQTGKDNFLLDRHSPTCTYIHCHKGDYCSMYVPLKDNDDFVKNDRKPLQCPNCKSKKISCNPGADNSSIIFFIECRSCKSLITLLRSGEKGKARLFNFQLLTIDYQEGVEQNGSIQS